MVHDLEVLWIRVLDELLCDYSMLKEELAFDVELEVPSWMSSLVNDLAIRLLEREWVVVEDRVAWIVG